ncbi:MAG TPA: hypothetical protein VG826_31570 [Pirellulales bacterium]|nr:hypothetical protein [Pirellulales bacterium]
MLGRSILNRTRCLTAVATGCLVWAASTFGDGPTALDGKRYLPLEKGREVRYRVTVTPPLGKAREASATNKVVERTVLNGKTYYKVTTTIEGVPFFPDTLIYYRPSAEGVYQVLEGDEKSPEWLYLPAKIELGDRWGAKKPSGDYEFTAVAVEDVETPGGKYARCLKLSVTMKTKFATNKQEQWLAPGVGVVKQTDSNVIFSSTTLLDDVKDPPK